MAIKVTIFLAICLSRFLVKVAKSLVTNKSLLFKIYYLRPVYPIETPN